MFIWFFMIQRETRLYHHNRLRKWKHRNRSYRWWSNSVFFFVVWFVIRNNSIFFKKTTENEWNDISIRLIFRWLLDRFAHTASALWTPPSTSPTRCYTTTICLIVSIYIVFVFFSSSCDNDSFCFRSFSTTISSNHA